MNETKKEFEKENASFLEIHPFVDMNEFRSRHIITIEDTIFNIGTQLIRLDSLAMSRRILSATYTNDEFSEGNLDKKFNELGITWDRGEGYIAKDKYLVLNSPLFPPVENDIYNALIKRKQYVFMVGKAKFTNMVTG